MPPRNWCTQWTKNFSTQKKTLPEIQKIYEIFQEMVVIFQEYIFHVIISQPPLPPPQHQLLLLLLCRWTVVVSPACCCWGWGTAGWGWAPHSAGSWGQDRSQCSGRGRCCCHLSKYIQFHINYPNSFSFLWNQIHQLLSIIKQYQQSSVADPGCLSRIRIFSIPDPGSRV